MWLQIAAAAAAVLGVGLVVVSKIVRGAVKYVDTRDQTVHETLINAMKEQGYVLEKGDMALAGAVEKLTDQLAAMSDQYATGQQAMNEKIDRIVEEVTHTNGGETVKGAIVTIKERVTVHDHQLRTLSDEMHRHHPDG